VPTSVGMTDQTTDQNPDPEPAAMVEAVMLGHLPGLAGPWLTQYAQLLADQTGPVLIIHVDEHDAPGSGTSVPVSPTPDQGRIDLELVEPNDKHHPASAPARGSVRVPPRPPSTPETDPAIGMIDAMVRARVGKVSTILLHLEADTDPKRLSRLLAIDDWTLLTGSDDIAVAGAQALLRKLAEADTRAAEKQVALMVMGAELRAAEAAARRIAQACEPIFKHPPLSLGSHARLGPVNVRQLGSFTGLGRLWPRLVAYFADLDTPEAPEVTEAPPPPAQPQPQPRTPPQHEPEAAAASARATPPRHDGLGASASASASAAAGASTSATATATAPPRRQRPAVTPRPPRPAAASGSATDPPPRLAELVAAGSHGITGGIALEARCPYQPLTELVLDEAGRLHLLRREVPVTAEDDATAAHVPDDAGIRAAIVDLVEARKWVREHLELLKLTLRDADFDAEADPSMHLFTAKAHLATPLVAKLGDQVRLHLLQQVTVGRESTWFTTPLN